MRSKFKSGLGDPKKEEKNSSSVNTAIDEILLEGIASGLQV
jgi:hypothetical protein